MTRLLSEQELVRRESLQKLRDIGVDPYPADLFDVNITSKQIKEKHKEGEELNVVLAGRLMSRRIMGKASFAELQDSE
jgi:lysyl-tRNA synthetase class 2